MPGFVKPEWKTTTWGNINASGDLLEMMICIAHGSDTVEYEGETITKFEYLKNYLFDGKYNDKIQLVDEGTCPGYDATNNFHVYGLYLDKQHNDRMAFFAVQANTSYASQTFPRIAIHNRFKLPDYMNSYSYGTSFIDAFAPSIVASNVRIRSFNTFCVIDSVNTSSGNNTTWNPNTSTRVVIVYDFTNHEMIIFDGKLRNIHFSKPDHYNYSQALTTDGSYDWNGTTVWSTKHIRKQSTSEISHCKLKLLDGTESTRFYMLTQFPVNADGVILTLQNKKLYVLPYDGDNYCAMAIECTADITGE